MPYPREENQERKNQIVRRQLILGELHRRKLTAISTAEIELRKHREGLGRIEEEQDALESEYRRLT